MFVPRPFQSEFCQKAVAHYETRNQLLCALGTGAGKTKTTALLFSRHITTGTVWILCHESSLVLQWLEALSELGISPEIISVCATKFQVPLDSYGDNDRHSTEQLANDCLGLRFGVRFVICMVKQVEKNLAEAKLLKVLPTYLVIDEGHLVLKHQGCRHLRVAAYANDNSFKMLVLTASPKAHGSLVVHPEDYVSRDNWITPITNTQLIAQGYWAKPEYVELPTEYLNLARDLFKGLRVDKDGEVSGTSQREVMKALTPAHVNIISKLERRKTETFMVYCATKEQSQELAAALQRRMGGVWLAVDCLQSAKYKADALAGLRNGSITGVCLVAMWAAGTDAPRASTCVIASVIMSFPRFYQLAGRIVRPFEGLTARYVDLGLNFIAKHPLMEDVDFMADFEASELTFADAHTLMCQNPACLHTHSRIPTPLHPRGLQLGKPFDGTPATHHPLTGDVIPGVKGQNLTIDLTTGIFNDGAIADPDAPLVCLECGSPVTGVPETIAAYVQWKESNGEDSKPRRMGITIGTGVGYQMTLAKMWATRLWAPLLEEGARTPKEEAIEKQLVDKSIPWEQRRSMIAKYRKAKSSVDRRRRTVSSEFISILDIDKQQIKANASKSENLLRKCLRISLGQCYLTSESPVKALDLIHEYGSLMDVIGLSGNRQQMETSLMVEAFITTYNRLLSTSPDKNECSRQFDEWIHYHLEDACQAHELAVINSPQALRLRKSISILEALSNVLLDKLQAA